MEFLPGNFDGQITALRVLLGTVIAGGNFSHVSQRIWPNYVSCQDASVAWAKLADGSTDIYWRTLGGIAQLNCIKIVRPELWNDILLGTRSGVVAYRMESDREKPEEIGNLRRVDAYPLHDLASDSPKLLDVRGILQIAGGSLKCKWIIHKRDTEGDHVLGWNHDYQRWHRVYRLRFGETLGRILAIDVLNGSPYFVRATDKGSEFIIIEDERLRILRTFEAQKEMTPHCLTVQGNRIVLGLGSTTGQSGEAVLAYHPEDRSYSPMGVQVRAGTPTGGVSFVKALPDNHLFVGGSPWSGLDFSGQDGSKGLLLKNGELLEASKSLHGGYGATAVEYYISSKGTPHILVAFVSNLERTALGLSPSCSCIQNLSI